MILDLVFIFGGLFVLVSSADFLVKGASSLAVKLKVSALVIGLTVVSFGTSTPELAVNLLAASSSAHELSIANIIGSNISNILLVLGTSAIIIHLKVKNSTVWHEIPIALLSISFLFFLILDEQITRTEGFELLFFLGVFFVYLFALIKKHRKSGILKEEAKTGTVHPTPLSLLYTIGGLIGLVVGSRLLVDGAVSFAEVLGLSQTFIGITIIGIGTSVPELATSLVAAKKGQNDLAIGNIVGSNIFNVLWIVGLTSVVNPLTVSHVVIVDLLVATFATLLLFLFMFLGKRHALTKRDGFIFVGLYISYLIFLLIRG
ncbi:MAG: calcium/sodium antiporter [bacterium]|nr:calcium/sodium antiporter [bacterium]